MKEPTNSTFCTNIWHIGHSSFPVWLTPELSQSRTGCGWTTPGVCFIHTRV